ncbi:MAG: GNAT family N-acetyltransferase [Clostridiales bacterium]|nr:GNAT family N-acetyltransferase [Clostridiales bacterium]
MYRSKDHEEFCRKGMAGLYETIGSLNLFMQCSAPNKDAFKMLHAGYLIRHCMPSELEIWKRVAAEAAYVDYVIDFYDKIYAKHEEEFFSRCMFICDDENKPVASAFIWHSYGLVNTVEWFRVLPEYEGMGLGRALLSEILKNAQFPMYLHTQPTSARAVKLYSDFGFKLITDPVVGYRKNDLAECLPHLKRILPQGDYEKLEFTKANDELLIAALSSEISEF